MTNFFTHYEMEDSNFASLNREIADDISGTEVQPLLVNVLHGKCGSGAVFVIKSALTRH